VMIVGCPLSLILSGHGSKGSCSAGGAASKFCDVFLTVRALLGRGPKVV
jgi:hypothetical protein